MNFFLISISFVILSKAFSQDSETILTELIISDSTTYNGRKIYVFNDKSWEYAEDYKEEYNYKAVKGNSGSVIFDTVSLLTQNWNEHKTFSTQYKLSELKDSVLIDVSGFVLPVGKMISGFKLRWGRWHKGNDFSCNVGTPVKACWDGVIRYAKYNHGGYGNLIIIRHYNGLETYYGHLHKISVYSGQKVKGGDLIGLSGNTGKSTGPHLHFEVRILDNAFDPELIYEANKTLLIHSGLFTYNPSNSKNISLKKIFYFG